jgi:plasmid stabilization system protein ParE
MARIASYVSEFDPMAARRLVEGVTAAGDDLANVPNPGQPVGSYQELTVVASYRLVCRVTDDQVRILRIWHDAEDWAS